MTAITVGKDGEISLPTEIRARYGVLPEQHVRVIETKDGVRLIPLTDDPMSPELSRELEAWQDLGAETIQRFHPEPDEP